MKNTLLENQNMFPAADKTTAVPVPSGLKTGLIEANGVRSGHATPLNDTREESPAARADAKRSARSVQWQMRKQRQTA